MPESTALEPLRKITRNAMLLTVVAVASLTPLSLIGANPGVLRSVVIGVGTAIFLYVHCRRLWRAVMRDQWEPIPLWRTGAVVAFVLALSAVGFTFSAQTGLICASYTGLVLAEIVIGRGPGAWRPMVVGSLFPGLLYGVVVALDGNLMYAPVAALGLILFVLFTAYCYAITFRQWEGTLKLDQARREAAELATVRERLRLAEDLHDILGHALQVVSLKSELAVRLGPVDPDRAQAEMVEVQALARGALQDVRALVQDNRPTDVGVELVGARKLLTSAGIECDFDVDDSVTHHRELFGRVLREAVTNLLRHADAGTCRVTLVAEKSEVVLRVRNDGVVSASARTDGSGLAGLARRVTEAGGTFQAGSLDPGSFEVVAKVPA